MSAAGGAYLASRYPCPSLEPSPSGRGGAHRPLTPSCPPSPGLAYPHLPYTPLPIPPEGVPTQPPDGLCLTAPCRVHTEEAGPHRWPAASKWTPPSRRRWGTPPTAGGRGKGEGGGRQGHSLRGRGRRAARDPRTEMRDATCAGTTAVGDPSRFWMSTSPTGGTQRGRGGYNRLGMAVGGTVGRYPPTTCHPPSPGTPAPPYTPLLAPSPVPYFLLPASPPSLVPSEGRTFAAAPPGPCPWALGCGTQGRSAAARPPRRSSLARAAARPPPQTPSGPSGGPPRRSRRGAPARRRGPSRSRRGRAASCSGAARPRTWRRACAGATARGGREGTTGRSVVQPARFTAHPS